MRILAWVVSAALLGACTAAGADGDGAGDAAVDGAEPEELTVAAGPDAESALLAEVMVGLLERAELPASTLHYNDARDARRALESGEVDVRTGYTGEAWLQSLERADPPGDVHESFVEVQAHDAEEGLVWLEPEFEDGLTGPPANATFAFMVAGPPSVDAGLTTMSQLATRLSEQGEATLCVDREFASRTDGLRAVLAAYSVRSDQPVLAAEPDEVVGAVLAGDCLAGLSTATDGAAWAAGLRPLVDDLEVFPAFAVLPQLSEEALEEQPGIEAALRPLASQLSTARLGRWNARVAAGEPLEQVAEQAVAELVELTGRPGADAEG